MLNHNAPIHPLKPKLRSIKTEPATERGQEGILISDPLGISTKTILVPGSLTLLLTLMDGTRDIGTIGAGYQLRTGRYLDKSILERFISDLDEALYLTSERFDKAYKATLEDYRTAPSRAPILAGKCYPPDKGELENFLAQYFDQVEDNEQQYKGDIRGLISPHIDFPRGGLTYARVWSKARAAIKQADLVVILGTDHNTDDGRITLTHQNYETPWGMLPTDQDAVNELANNIGQGVFDCELNHRMEHSVEAAVIWLHYLTKDKPCRVLPIICGSFTSFIERNEEPKGVPHIASTIDILRGIIGTRKTIVVAAADLAHEGPAFGDYLSIDLAEKARMARNDRELIDIIIGGNADDFFTKINNEKDRRHVCGAPPIYIALSSLAGIKGESVSYEQCPASEDGTSFVSICGVLFYASN
jgi:AmmeMemoRadiSam system protein B